MPKDSPYRIILTSDEQARLEAQTRKYTSPYRDVIRAKIVLLAAQGLSNDVIAARLDTPRRLSASGASDLLCSACQASRNNLAAGVRPAFPPSLIV